MKGENGFFSWWEYGLHGLFFSLLLGFCLGMVTEGQFVVLFFVLGMSVIGVPHGATDLWRLHSLSSSRSVQIGLGVVYLGVTVTGIFLSLRLPNIFWSLFFALAAFHFWRIEQKPKSKGFDVRSPESALLAVYILPILDPEKFLMLMKNLGAESYAYLHLEFRVLWIGLFCVCLLSGLLGVSGNKRAFAARCLKVSVLLLVGVLAPLEIAFGFYFLLFHSSRHLQQMMGPLQITAVQYLFWCIFPSLILIGFSLWFLPSSKSAVIPIFQLLAGLTLAHSVLDEYFRYSEKTHLTRS